MSAAKSETTRDSRSAVSADSVVSNDHASDHGARTTSPSNGRITNAAPATASTATAAGVIPARGPGHGEALSRQPAGRKPNSPVSLACPGPV